MNLPSDSRPINLRLGEYGREVIPYGDDGPDPYNLRPFFAQLQSSDDRLADAARRAARILDGDPDPRRADVGAELEMVLEERRTMRSDLADLIFNGLRVAVKERPADLYEVLAPLFLPGLQADIDDCAAAVATLERDRRAGR